MFYRVSSLGYVMVIYIIIPKDMIISIIIYMYHIYVIYDVISINQKHIIRGSYNRSIYVLSFTWEERERGGRHGGPHVKKNKKKTKTFFF